MAIPQPLILTLAFEEAAFQHFQALRQQHFPKHRNFIPAHLTLFHHLPGDEEAQVIEVVSRLCRATPPMPMEVAGLRFLGRGVAYDMRSPALMDLRQELAHRWQDRLIPQDRNGFRPHITIQNKVSPEEARRLFDVMQNTFAPWTFEATGLLMWRYLGGPWEKIGYYPFQTKL